MCISRRLGRVHIDTSVFCELSVKTGPLIREPRWPERILDSLRGQHTKAFEKRLQIAIRRRICYTALGSILSSPHSRSSIFRQIGAPLREKFASAVCVDGLSPRNRTRPEKRTIQKLVDT